MNKEDIIRMAREAGEAEGMAEFVFHPVIERFADLVASAEREACAKQLDEASGAAKNVDPQGFVWKAVKECAYAIRARGETK
jgi:hypothetical protein